VLITNVQNPVLQNVQGKRLAEIARERNKDAADVLIDLLIQDRAQTGMIVFLMQEEDLRTALAQPWVKLCTDYNCEAPDGPMFEGQSPHPRAYGTYPRLLGRYVREARVLSLEEAVRKSTWAVASRVGIADRGLVCAGFAADLVVFDEGKILDQATFEKPMAFPLGIAHVLVNGVLAVRDGAPTGQRGGRALRGPGHRQGP
jgi:N-acyl-D-aspartate/D-glutamate deacylase